MAEKEREPEVAVEQVSLSGAARPGGWLVTWEVRNKEGTLRILSGRLPHGRFKGDETELMPAPTLAANESATLEFAVACDEPPGTIIENAFLILRTDWLEAPWLILARLRVCIDENGAPQSATELISTQRVGFSTAMK